MNTTQPNEESLEALKKLAKEPRGIGAVPDEGLLQAIASCGILDLNQAVNAYYAAVSSIEKAGARILEHRKKIDDLLEWSHRTWLELSDPNEQLKHLSEVRKTTNGLETELLTLSGETIPQLREVSPIGQIEMARALFSFIEEVRRAIRWSRELFSGYQGPFLERFVLPALEGTLSSQWPDDSIWRDVVDQQIIQRIPDDEWKQDRPDRRVVFAALKKNLTPERIHILVVAISASEKCDADALKSLIEKQREMAKEYPDFSW